MSKEGKHYKYGKLEFWAERGLIHIIDERFESKDPKFYTVATVKMFAERLDAFSNELKNVRYRMYPHDKNIILTLLENGVNCGREAQEQGMPDDLEALADLVNDRRRTWALGNGRSDKLSKESAILGADGKPFVLDTAEPSITT